MVGNKPWEMSGMSDKASCQFCSREGRAVSSIAAEARGIVLDAAGDTAGLTVKGQLRKAARALGYRDSHWRIRAAWYGEAQSWSAEALEDLRARYRAWDARQAALAAEQDKTHAALLRAGATALESGSDAELDRSEARRMRSQADRLGHGRPRYPARRTEAPE